MVAAINPDAETGPTGMFMGAGIFAFIAGGTLVSGLHPRWRSIATWYGLISRFIFGSLAFSAGVLIIGIAMTVRGILEQHGPFAGVVLWLSCVGAAMLVRSPVYDLVQNKRMR